MFKFKQLISISLLALLTATSSSAFAEPTIEIKTTAGNIIIELDAKKAPKTVENFLKYAKKGFYDGTIFHRVIDSFMIQGGGFDKEMNELPTDGTIENEAKNGLKNTRGSIAMARRNEPHSASSQFFINHKDNAMLNFSGEQDGRTWGYAVFGQVREGMDIVDKIAQAKTGNKGMFQDVPVTPIIIQSVTVSGDENTKPVPSVTRAAKPTEKPTKKSTPKKTKEVK